MDLYILVEYLKKQFEFIKTRVSDNYHDYEIEKNYRIAHSLSDMSSKVEITKYDIESNSGGEEWHFLLMPTPVLYAIRFEDLRKKLIDRYCIKAIITIKNAFFSIPTIPQSIVVLGEPDTRVYLTSASCTYDFVSLMKHEATYTHAITYTSKLSYISFMPEFYKEDESLELQKYFMNTRKLGEISTIINGRNAGQSSFSANGIPYLRGRNIKDGKIVNVDTYIREEEVEEFSRQLLEEGDIVLQKHFGYHKIAQITADDLPAIASSGLIIIREGSVPNDYLFKYFMSPTGRRILNSQIDAIETGVTMKSIPIRRLADIQVPVFDKSTMEFCGQEDAIDINQIISVLRNYSLEEKEPITEDQIIKKVYEDLKSVGWEETDIAVESKEHMIYCSYGQDWIPDIVLSYSNKSVAIVEVKSNMWSFDSLMVRRIKKVIARGEIPFVILSTGSYYEIHSSKDTIVEKRTSAPSKEYMLGLLNDMESGKDEH